MNKERLIKIIATMVAVVILVVGTVFIYNKYSSKAEGQIVVSFENEQEEVIKKQKIDFYEGDTLVELIEANFDNVKMGEGASTGMIMEIEDYVTPSDWSTFVMIYVDDVPSDKGINQIEFVDGTKISLRITAFVYEE